jgi:hypothetical protein
MDLSGSRRGWRIPVPPQRHRSAAWEGGNAGAIWTCYNNIHKYASPAAALPTTISAMKRVGLAAADVDGLDPPAPSLPSAPPPLLLLQSKLHPPEKHWTNVRRLSWQDPQGHLSRPRQVPFLISVHLLKFSGQYPVRHASQASADPCAPWTHWSNAARSSGHCVVPPLPPVVVVGPAAGAAVSVPLHSIWHDFSNCASKAQFTLARISAWQLPHSHVARPEQTAPSMSEHWENKDGNELWMHPAHRLESIPASPKQVRTAACSSGHGCGVGAGLTVKAAVGVDPVVLLDPEQLLNSQSVRQSM